MTVGHDDFESRLSTGLNRIAATTPAREPGRFDPQAMPVIDHPHRPRNTGVVLVAAAIAVVAVVGLIAINQRNTDPGASANTNAANTAPAGPRFRFVSPTVRLEADSVEVITPSGTFVPTPDVQVEGDPGTPDKYTTLELTWTEHVEQRIYIYFASDGHTWWATEIRTYNGLTPGDWFEPISTGRMFERPLGTAYTGDIDLPNLHITGMTLQAFVAPASCQSPTAPVALIADYPAIHGFTPNGGFGASFQIIDTATCTPLPVGRYAFHYTVDDPAVAVVTSSGAIDRPTDTEPLDPTATIEPSASTTASANSPTAIKALVGLDFPGAGTTTLHVTVTDASGTTIGALDVPINVTPRADVVDGQLPTTSAEPFVPTTTA